MYLNANLMKKLMLAVLMVFCLKSIVSAQLENLRIGMQLSPTMSWISTNDDLINRTSSNIGVSVGVVAEYMMSEHISFTGGIGLAFNRGGTLQHEYGGNFFPDSELSDDKYNTGEKPLPDGVKLKYKLQYVEIPVGIKWKTEEKGDFRYFAEAPILTVGMRTQARGDIDGGDVSTSNENIGPDVSFFNFQIGVGAGLEYAISQNTSLVGGLYFNAGLSDITNNAATKAIDNPDQAPSNPNDDYIIEQEDSIGRLSSITLRIAIMF
jgi:outer membrane protein with beta-barrel domain